MSRRWFVIVLVCLAMVETGILVKGWTRPRDPLEPVAAAAGPPPAEAPERLISPSLYIEPDAGFNWVYAQVGSARSTVDLVMYELVDPMFSAALVAACQRGVTVRVILDQNLERSANTPAYNQLGSAGPNCKVAWANPDFPATHQKTMIVDENRAVIMSFNLTSRYYANTRDMGVLDTDTADTLAIRLAFQKDFASTAKDPPPPLSGHNLIWSPTTAEDNLVSLIRASRKTLLVENEELAAPVIVDALAAACRRGVAVELAMTDTNEAYHVNFAALEAAGCGVHLGLNDNNTLYIHAKAMVADLGTSRAIGYLGSINFSDASMNKNRELGLYVHDPKLLAQMATTMEGDYHQFPTYHGTSTAEQRRVARP